MRTENGIGGKHGEVVSTEVDGCLTPPFISMSARAAFDAVLYAKDCVRDVRVLVVRVALNKTGAHLTVKLTKVVTRSSQVARCL